jgi:two-component system chemotaxis response regulator CheB
MVRVLVVDDSLIAREMIAKILRSDPEIEIVGTAKNGVEAIDMTARLKPSIITMDVNMPVMNGLEAIKEIMAYTPTPILVISSLVSKEVEIAFKALEAGALDVFEKPTMGVWEGQEKLERELKAKVKFLSKVKVITHLSGKKARREKEKIKEEVLQQVKPVSKKPVTPTKFKVIAIGASTGGPKALQEILPYLPQDFPIPIVIVQHIVDGFTEGLVEWLEMECEMKVKLGNDGDELTSGTIFVAPSRTHMLVDKYKHIKLDNSPPVGGHKPAANVLLSSVAEVFGSSAIGVILTGMGGDGAEGLKAIRDAGGSTIVQDEDSCVVFGMPKVAIELGAAQKIFPPQMIRDELMRLVMG